jgi:hypothetical protein
MRIPDGWEFVSEYCIRNGEFTICRYGTADGWRYELWQLKEQLAGNLPSSQAAIDLWMKCSS